MAALLLACGESSSPAAARAEAGETATPVIRVQGEARVSAPPDRASLQIGVVSEATTAKGAAADNAAKLSATLKALRAALGEDAEVETRGYSLNPRYRHDRQSGKRELTGYTASNQLQVTTADLEELGALIDTATAAGANNVQSLNFHLADDAALRSEALTLAAKAARAKADALAGALDLKVLRVLEVQEGGASVRPPHDGFARMAQAEATPIEPGDVEIRASVSLTVEVSR